MERQILHLRVKSFGVAVYRVKDPSLRDRPLIVSAGRGPRAVVLSVSEEAQGEGARPGMTLPEALRWCRRALVLPPDPVLLDRAQKSLAEILSRFSPVVEPVRGGRLYADLSGTGRLLGPPADAARRIQREVERRLGLGPNAGLGTSKLISGVAAGLLSPVSLLDVLPGQEVDFLSPLAVGRLPAVDSRTEGCLLDELNIRKVRDLAAIELARLSLAFGSKGFTLYRQARGIDESPVRPPDRAPAVEADETLPEDTNDDAVLLGCLYALVERCGARLRALGLPAGEATLTARYSDGVTVSRRIAFSPPSAWDGALYGHARTAFERIVQRRGRVRYMRVRFTKLAAAPPAQMAMFCDGEEKGAANGSGRDVIEALDRIRRRFGNGAIAFGRTRGVGKPPAGARGAGEASDAA